MAKFLQAGWESAQRGSEGGEACPPCIQKGCPLTTPQAPWTPNWMQKAPAASALKLVGKIQSGMNAPVRRTKMLREDVNKAMTRT